MRLRKAIIMRYRSVDYLDIDMGPLTILFGKNNVGKTNMLEAIYGILAPETMRGYPGAEDLAGGVRGDDTSVPVGAVYADVESSLVFDDRVLRQQKYANERYRGLDSKYDYIRVESPADIIEVYALGCSLFDRNYT